MKENKLKSFTKRSIFTVFNPLRLRYSNLLCGYTVSSGVRQLMNMLLYHTILYVNLTAQRRHESQTT